MGTVLAGMAFFAFFYEGAPAIPISDGPPVERVPVKTPTLDGALLGKVRDGERQQRLTIEAKPLAHLLEQSLDIVPAVAEALGRPKVPVPIEELRANPQNYRGQYLWYKGRLRHVSHGKDGHPVEGFRVYEGWIDTDEGDQVMFRVSLEPRDIAVNDYVRVEGFFLKLKDSHNLPKTDRAPVLVGPELFLDFPPWEPVTELDQALLDSINDEIYSDVDAQEVIKFDEADLLESTDAYDTLEESQYLPLWHLTSYAQHRNKNMTLVDWRRIKPFVEKEQLDDIRLGVTPKGTPLRVVGQFIFARTWKARANPIGVEDWTQLWVQIHDLGGKLVPVWVPQEVQLARNTPLELRTYYFRRHLYLTSQGGIAVTPIFVTDSINRFVTLPPDAATTWLKWGFVALVSLLIAFFILMARRDRSRLRAHRREMDERRRRREQRATLAAES